MQVLAVGDRGIPSLRTVPANSRRAAHEAGGNETRPARDSLSLLHAVKPSGMIPSDCSPLHRAVQARTEHDSQFSKLNRAAVDFFFVFATFIELC